MLHYMMRRIFQSLPLIFAISVLCFVLMELAPYDAVDVMTTPNMPPATVAALKAHFGLDKPPAARYLRWLENALRGEFGYSIASRSEIGPELASRVGMTAILVVPSYLLAFVFALVLGLWAGSRPGSRTDRLIDGLSAVASALPSFWVALLLIYAFSFSLKLLPILGMHTTGRENSALDLLWHLILPVFVLALANLPELVRYIRSAASVQMNSEYVLVQRALGSSLGEVVRRHVMRNVLLPVVTLAGMSLPMLITGAVITESVFSWPGMGSYFVKAIQSLDYPVVLAILLFSSTAVVVGNLLADLLYGLVDPRVRTGGRR